MLDGLAGGYEGGGGAQKRNKGASNADLSRAKGRPWGASPIVCYGRRAEALTAWISVARYRLSCSLTASCCAGVGDGLFVVCAANGGGSCLEGSVRDFGRGGRLRLGYLAG